MSRCSRQRPPTRAGQCQMGRVSQGNCRGVGSILRDTGKTRILLCARCDARWGDVVGKVVTKQ